MGTWALVAHRQQRQAWRGHVEVLVAVVGSVRSWTRARCGDRGEDGDEQGYDITTSGSRRPRPASRRGPAAPRGAGVGTEWSSTPGLLGVVAVEARCRGRLGRGRHGARTSLSRWKMSSKQRGRHRGGGVRGVLRAGARHRGSSVATLGQGLRGARAWCGRRHDEVVTAVRTRCCRCSGLDVAMR